MALRERLELLTRRKVLSSHRTERVPLFFFFLIFSPVPFGERGRGEEGPVAANGRASRQRASQSPVGQEQEGLGLRWVGDRVTSESREGN